MTVGGLSLKRNQIGASRNALRLEVHVPCHDRPGNAGNLVGKRDCNKLEGLLRQQATRPIRQRRISRPLLHPVEGCVRPNHEEFAQVPVAHFGNGAQPWFATGRMLPGDKAQPGCELTSAFEQLWGLRRWPKGKLQ